MQKLNYPALAARAEKHSRAVWKRAWKLAMEAGCGHVIHMHNAMCDREYGKPWPEIDYAKLRKARWLMSKQWEAKRVIDKLYSRKGNAAFDWK